MIKNVKLIVTNASVSYFNNLFSYLDGLLSNSGVCVHKAMGYLREYLVVYRTGLQMAYKKFQLLQ